MNKSRTPLEGILSKLHWCYRNKTFITAAQRRNQDSYSTTTKNLMLAKKQTYTKKNTFPLEKSPCLGTYANPLSIHSFVVLQSTWRGGDSYPEQLLCAMNRAGEQSALQQQGTVK